MPRLDAMFCSKLLESLLVPADVRKARNAWKHVAQGLGLAYVRGPHRRYVQGDRLEGAIEGRHVTAEARVNWDAQKVVVTVAVELMNCPTLIRLGGEELAAWYEQQRAKAPSLPPIAQELRPWIAGERKGIGAFLEERSLMYRQLYGIDDVYEFGFLLEHLARWAPHIDVALESAA